MKIVFLKTFVFRRYMRFPISAVATLYTIVIGLSRTQSFYFDNRFNVTDLLSQF